MTHNSLTRVVFLGGAGEIGRNMTVFEHDGMAFILDCGLMFPTEDMLGVDLVLPDYTYLAEADLELVGIVLTHGHEDHVGGLPYFLREFSAPIYGTRLTLGLVRPKLEEHRLLDESELHEIDAPGKLTLGPFSLGFMPVCHSIPDGVATTISTPSGRILHSGDFRIDPTPVDGRLTDLDGFAQVGREGVDLMLSDSTNADRRGASPSEKVAGRAVAEAVAAARGRVIVACFASNIHRVQQILWAGAETGRKVAFMGRSMIRNVEVAGELGYLEVDDDLVMDIDELADLPADQQLVVSTGSQGEPLSALSLMSAREHKWIELGPDDTVILSATPIPGNESAVRRVIDGLWRIGAEVVRPPESPVHVSGHGTADDLAHVVSLVKPSWFVPVHGEYRHMALHARIAERNGVPQGHALIVEDGDVLELKDGEVRRAGRVHAGYTFVDGLGIGDVREEVLRDRRLLAGDGIVVAVVTIDSQTGELMAGPDLISRGFVDEEEGAEFYEGAAQEIRDSLAGLAHDEISDWTVVRRHVRRALGKYVWEETRRRPIILPVVMEV